MPRWRGNSTNRLRVPSVGASGDQKEDHVKTLTPEELDRLLPQAIGWLTKIERVKQDLSPARARKLQAKIDAEVADRLAEPASS